MAAEYKTRAWQTVGVDLGPSEARDVDMVAPAIAGVAEMGLPVTPQVRCISIHEQAAAKRIFAERATHAFYAGGQPQKREAQAGEVGHEGRFSLTGPNWTMKKTGDTAELLYFVGVPDGI